MKLVVSYWFSPDWSSMWFVALAYDSIYALTSWRTIYLYGRQLPIQVTWRVHVRYRQIRPCLPPVGVWYLLFSRKEFTFLSAIFPIFEYIIPYNIRYVKYMRYVLSVTPIAMVGTYEVLVDTWWVSVSTYGYQIWYQLVSESDTCMVSSYPDGIMWYSNPLY